MPIFMSLARTGPYDANVSNGKSIAVPPHQGSAANSLVPWSAGVDPVNLKSPSPSCRFFLSMSHPETTPGGMVS